MAAPAEIPEHVQEQLLSDYEKELQTDKSLQKELGDAKTAVATTTTDVDEKSERNSPGKGSSLQRLPMETNGIDLKMALIFCYVYAS